jgi:hypothetical protein
MGKVGGLISGAIEYWKWDGELGMTLFSRMQGGRGGGKKKQSILFITFRVVNSLSLFTSHFASPCLSYYSFQAGAEPIIYTF